MITLQEHIDKMKRIAQELTIADKPVRLASGSAIARFAERVFVKGQDTGGGTFEYNSTKPLYVNPAKTFGNTSALKPPRGKTGKTKFASTGDAHKTTWVESYKALRAAVDRESTFVNWTAVGDLKSEIENRSLIKLAEAEYKMAVTSDENTDKLRGLIRKYPNVFELSEEERKAYFRAFNLEYLKLIKEKFA